VAITLENTQLSDRVEDMKNYNQCILQSMSNGVITIDGTGMVVASNAAAGKLLGLDSAQMTNQACDTLFDGDDSWLPLLCRRVSATGRPQVTMDARLHAADGPLSVNVTVQPLIAAGCRRIGSMIVLDDITSEKRARAAIGRYLGPQVVDRVLSRGNSILRGRSMLATILFADIRNFSGLSR
jgi:adenylate cyclase